MAKIRGPLLSFSGGGSIGKAVTFSKWKGIPYTRQYVIPANPQTVDQMARRDIFSWLNLLYRAMTADLIAPWDASVVGRPLTPRNQFLKTNLQPLVVALNTSGLVASPGVAAGPAPSAFNAATGGAAGEVDIDITEGTLPDGWSVDTATLWMMKAGAITLATFDPEIQSNTISSPGPYSATLTGEVNAQNYQCFGFFKYLRADGKAAYSVSLTAVAASHA